MASPPPIYAPITAKELADEVGLSLHYLDKAFREEHAHLLAEFCDPWENIGYHLKLTKVDISTIKNDNGTTNLRRISMLETWSEKFAHKATYRILIEALIQSKRAKQALNLCRVLKREILTTDHHATEKENESVTPSDPLLPVTELTTTACHVTPNKEHVPQSIDVARSIRQLQMQFVRIQNRFLLHGGGTRVTLEQLQTCISTLPSFTTDTPQALLEASSIQNFIHNLKNYCCALNPDILEDLIEVLGDAETKSMMNSYNRDLHDFRSRTKLKDFVGNYNGQTPPDFKEVQLKLGDDWREKTLADLKLLSSQISRQSWLVKMASIGSVYVMFMIPQEDDLELGIHLRDYLQSQDVLQILVCGVCIFNCEVAQHRLPQKIKIGFKSVQLFKDQTLGIGSYGAVCKAKCDDLLCAAKILHTILFDPTAQLQISPKQEHRLPIKRIEQECEFLSTICHPNIVQYLCMHQDPDTGLPVLLMELMDESLTHFLESSPQPIAYHIQANICHDITLALSFLHSNGIIHRDLSSNNVLLRGKVLAKVTDFGMAKLGDLNPQATRYIFTMGPGTDVYMPPEALKDKPVYTEKIDCFSFGVIVIQISTRQFPKPGNRQQQVRINHPGVQQEIQVAEVDRRQNHISQVDPNHPFLPIALDCLKDKDTERPSAQQLCERVASLKERPEYSDSVVAAQYVNQQLRQLYREEIEKIQREKERELRQIRQELQQKLAKEREDYRQHEHRHKEEFQQTVREREIQLRQVREQLKISELERAELERQCHKRDGQLREMEVQLQRWRDQTHQEMVKKVDDIKLIWREGKKAPFVSRRCCDTVLNGNRVYFRKRRQLWNYDNYDNKGWSELPGCPYSYSSLTILNSLPTTIGGVLPGTSSFTNKVMSLTTQGRWVETFPPMPTKRVYVTAVYTRSDLIVAGGMGVSCEDLTTVEVLNIMNRQWSTAVDLPEPLLYSSSTVCGDQLYMLGGEGDPVTPTNSVYTCSLSALLQTCTQRSLEEYTVSLSLSDSSSHGTGIWNELANLPVTKSTCVTFCGQLLAVGGWDSDCKPTKAVYKYNSSTDSWNVISHMITARRWPFAAVLPDNQLMVVGGVVDNHLTDFVEFGHLI